MYHFHYLKKELKPAIILLLILLWKKEIYSFSDPWCSCLFKWCYDSEYHHKISVPPVNLNILRSFKIFIFIIYDVIFKHVMQINSFIIAVVNDNINKISIHSDDNISTSIYDLGWGGIVDSAGVGLAGCSTA